MTKPVSIAGHNAQLLNLFAFRHGTIFARAGMLPFCRERIGLELWPLMAGEALFAAVIIVAEIPAGWLADHWKRKYCLAPAGVTGFTGFGMPAAALA